MAPFDPVAESVVLPRQKKKKAAITKQRPSQVTVVMMKEYCPTIPKGKFRQKLASKGKIQTLRFTRIMTHSEVRDKILDAFDVRSFVVLDCDNTGHNLIKSSDQLVDGERAIVRKGALYLCENFDMVCLIIHMLRFKVLFSNCSIKISYCMYVAPLSIYNGLPLLIQQAISQQ